MKCWEIMYLRTSTIEKCEVRSNVEYMMKRWVFFFVSGLIFVSDEPWMNPALLFLFFIVGFFCSVPSFGWLKFLRLVKRTNNERDTFAATKRWQSLQRNPFSQHPLSYLCGYSSFSNLVSGCVFFFPNSVFGFALFSPLLVLSSKVSMVFLRIFHSPLCSFWKILTALFRIGESSTFRLKSDGIPPATFKPGSRVLWRCPFFPKWTIQTNYRLSQFECDSLIHFVSFGFQVHENSPPPDTISGHPWKP